MIDVTSDVTVYELDGKETSMASRPKIQVASHERYSANIVLVVDGKRYTVSLKDIEAAIKNASNAAWV